MKKKIISLILILAMLILPFGMFLNVNATDITTNSVTYNNERTKAGDNESYFVTGKADITIRNITTTSDNTAGDTFKAYKVLDTYYNPTSNQISYGFTSDFTRFVGNLSASDIQSITGDNNKTAFTVNDYLALTSDTEPNTTGNATNSSVSTASSLNRLVSKYATYIRKNAEGANAVNSSVTNMTTNTSESTATASQVEAGAYLILPDSQVFGNIKSGFINSYSGSVYGVMVANVFYQVNNNAWQLNNVSINAKYSYWDAFLTVQPKSVTEMDPIIDSDDEEVTEMWSSRAGDSTNATSGSTISTILTHNNSEIPTNTHESIYKENTNEVIKNLISYSTVTLPAGLSFRYSDVSDNTGLTKIGDDYYAVYGEEYSELIIKPVNSTTVKIYGWSRFNIDVSNDYAFTPGVANKILVTRYYIKDAYVDIGSNVTEEEVIAALADDLENPTARQLAIQKGIGKKKYELDVYVYGLKINNTNSSNDNLNGGVFQAYSDASCTTPIGTSFTIANGVGSIVGISGYDVVYIKQIKAPTGYQLYDKIIDLYPYEDNNATPATGHVKVNSSLGQDNYYEITVVNQPMLFLPFTGGTGTIIYTVIGLVIVAGAITFIIIYKKKNKK